MQECAGELCGVCFSSTVGSFGCDRFFHVSPASSEREEMVKSCGLPLCTPFFVFCPPCPIVPTAIPDSFGKKTRLGNLSSSVFVQAVRRCYGKRGVRSRGGFAPSVITPIIRQHLEFVSRRSHSKERGVTSTAVCKMQTTPLFTFELSFVKMGVCALSPTTNSG